MYDHLMTKDFPLDFNCFLYFWLPILNHNDVHEVTESRLKESENWSLNWRFNDVQFSRLRVSGARSEDMVWFFDLHHDLVCNGISNCLTGECSCRKIWQKCSNVYDGSDCVTFDKLCDTTRDGLMSVTMLVVRYFHARKIAALTFAWQLRKSIIAPLSIKENLKNVRPPRLKMQNLVPYIPVLIRDTLTTPGDFKYRLVSFNLGNFVPFFASITVLTNRISWRVAGQDLVTKYSALRICYQKSLLFSQRKRQGPLDCVIWRSRF